jgi:hypothetical protein
MHISNGRSHHWQVVRGTRLDYKNTWVHRKVSGCSTVVGPQSVARTFRSGSRGLESLQVSSFAPINLQ